MTNYAIGYKSLICSFLPFLPFRLLLFLFFSFFFIFSFLSSFLSFHIPVGWAKKKWCYFPVLLSEIPNEHMKCNLFKWKETLGGLGLCISHFVHFVFELCKNTNIQSIEMLLIDNGKSSQEPHNGDMENWWK